LLSLDVARINLKCDPDQAERLREEHICVEPGYHMNKKHWNSIYWEREALRPDDLKRWIRDSYELIIAKLPKKDRDRLQSSLADAKPYK